MGPGPIEGRSEVTSDGGFIEPKTLKNQVYEYSFLNVPSRSNKERKGTKLRVGTTLVDTGLPSGTFEGILFTHIVHCRRLRPLGLSSF